MRRALALLLLSLPLNAQEADLAGIWSGTITTIGTGYTTSYSPITGVTIVPSPALQVTPAPFGPLEMDAGGTYRMPVMGWDGEWAVEASLVTFSGGLSGVPARFEMLETGPVVILDLPLGDGSIQTVTYSRTAH